MANEKLIKKIKVLKIKHKIGANEEGYDVLDDIVLDADIEISYTLTLGAGKTLELYGIVYLLVSGGTVVDYCKDGYEGIEPIILM